MDAKTVEEHALEEMEWTELLLTLDATIKQILADTLNPLSPPPPPPVPAVLEINTQCQSAESQFGGFGGCTLLGADPYMFEHQGPMMAAPTTYDASAYSPGEYLPYQWPMHYVPTVAPVGHPAAAPPPHPNNNVAVVSLTRDQSRRCVGVLNGELLYEVTAENFAPLVFAAPPLNDSNLKKRKCERLQDNEQLYVKKPLNAFMLFIKEQRMNVEAHVKADTRGTAAVNKVLGQMWNSLTKEEQAKYYDQAEEERLLHAQRHPNWCSRDNYGKKRKLQSRKTSIRAEASASRPKEETQQVKWLCVTPVQTALMEPSSSLTAAVEAPHMKKSSMEPHVPVCDLCKLPQVGEVSSA